MARVGMRHIAGTLAVVGAIGGLGRAAIGHLMHHHNGLFVGQGSDWYDRLSPHLVGPFYRRVVDEVVVARPSGLVLDVGCGPGHVAVALARCAPELEVCGVDISTDMIRRAKANVARAGLGGRVRFEVSQATRLPLADASVELAVTTLSMHHWTDVPAMLRELARVIRPGGQVWIYDIRQTAMEARTLERLLPEQPFATPRIEPVALRVGPVPLRGFVRCVLERR
ncbi:MAG TPA: class I SAM-dependent methyltransferase [Roseiflexaceae bacterium]|nr:class I SAM-dependent methyltransferase [Roseiflexaceae bacterium]